MFSELLGVKKLLLQDSGPNMKLQKLSDVVQIVSKVVQYDTTPCPPKDLLSIHNLATVKGTNTFKLIFQQNRTFLKGSWN